MELDCCQKRHNKSSKKTEKRHIHNQKASKSWLSLWLAYTLLFVLLFSSLLCYFASGNRSLVYHADAWRQHLRAFAYYGKWLRGCLWNLIHNHSLELQSWSFGLGYGADVLTTLQYYCFGEPLASLTVFVPEEYSKLYFEFLIVLRPYLAGLSFMLYARYALGLRQGTTDWIWRKGRKNRCERRADEYAQNALEKTAEHRSVSRTAILAGALCYSFCGTVLYLGMLHPFFVTPMIYLPLLLLGVERILQERRPVLFMVTVWMAALTNFYFFYMLAILTALYGTCRVIAIHCGKENLQASHGETHKEIAEKTAEKTIEKTTQSLTGKTREKGHKKAHQRAHKKLLRRMLLDWLRLLGYAAVGAMTAGGILVPVLIQFRSDPRSATDFSLSLFYEPEYYQELFRNLVTFINHPLYDTELCMTIAGAAALVILFLRTGGRQLKAAVIGCAVMLCLPAAGYLMNGLSYVINRWTFGAEFLIAFVLTVVWNDVKIMHRTMHRRCNRSCNGSWNEGLDRSESRRQSRRQRVSRNSNRRVNAAAEGLVLALVVLLIAVNINLGYARIPAGEDGEGGQSGYASEFTDAQTPAEYMLAASYNEAAAVTEYDPDLFRYTGRDLTYNAGAQLGTSSTQFFWSFANGVVSDFFELLGVCEEQNFCYTGLDDRTILETLAGVQYYTIAYDNSYEQQFVPYGFEDCGTVAGDSGVPDAVKAELEQSRKTTETEETEVVTDTKETVGTEVGSNETESVTAAPEGIAEWSGAVLGDDSWEAVRPEYHIYRNTFALPLGYTYTGVISQEKFAVMTPTQRQEALVQGVVLGEVAQESQTAEGNSETAEEETMSEQQEQTSADGTSILQKEAEITYYEQELSYTIETSDGVSYQSEKKDGNSASDILNDFSNDTSDDISADISDGSGVDESSLPDEDANTVRFVVTEPGATVIIRFDGMDGAETYVELLNLNVETLSAWNAEGSTENTDERAGTQGNTESVGDTEEDTLQEVYPITFTASRAGESLTDKTINYKTPVNQYYSGWTDFALNMGYNGSAVDAITVCFQQTGVYEMSDLKIVCQPTESIMQQALELSAVTMQNTDLHQNSISKATNEITGEITAEQDRILVFSIPYSSGWEAYDNGEKVELQKANVMYMAIPISAGVHEIRLVYHTPGGRIGGLIALIGVQLMIGIAMHERVRQKRNRG